MALKEQTNKYNPLGNSINKLKIFCHNLPTTNAGKPIKASRDADFSLVSLIKKTNKYHRGVGARSGNLGQIKITPRGWSPGSGKPWPKKAKPILPLNISSPNNLKFKTSKLFF